MEVGTKVRLKSGEGPLMTVKRVTAAGYPVCYCAGLRTPATATHRHAPTAGVGNWPRDEIAGGGR